MLDAKDNQIGAIHHFTVPCLVDSLKVAASGGGAYFYFIVVIPVGILVIPEVCRWIWQHPDMGAVIVPERAVAAANGGGNYLVIFSVPAHHELYKLNLLQELADQHFESLFYRKRIHQII